MKSFKIVHHTGKDGTVFSDVETQIELLRTLIGGTGVVDLANTGLKVRDTDASNDLIIKPGSDLTADRTLTIVTGDADRSLTLSASTVLNGGTQSGTNTGDQTFDGLAPATTRGDLIVRGASSNIRLPLGASGTVLSSDGTDAAWVASGGGVVTLLAPTSFPAATNVTITGIAATYSYLVLQIVGASSDTNTREVLVQVSVDNGSNYDSTAANYVGYGISTVTVSNLAKASMIVGATIPATSVHGLSLKIAAYQGGMTPQSVNKYTTTGGGNVMGSVTYIGSTSAINAIKILWDGSGNFDAGTYALYGVK